MNEFQVIEVKSLRMRLYNKVWRFQYRLRRKAARLAAKLDRRFYKISKQPVLYRIEIRG